MSDPHGHEGQTAESAFVPGLPDYYTAYFYYIKYSPAGRQSVAAYEWFDIKNKITDIDQRVQALVTNATVNNGTDPRCYAADMDSLLRRRKGYYIVAVEGRRFLGTDPISFFGTDMFGTPNDGKHTFTHVKTLQGVPTASGTSASVAVYANEMKGKAANGSLRTKEWEDFQVTLHFAPLTEAEPDKFLDDGGSGGTNMGPPPPPPSRRLGEHGGAANAGASRGDNED